MMITICPIALAILMVFIVIMLRFYRPEPMTPIIGGIVILLAAGSWFILGWIDKIGSSDLKNFFIGLFFGAFIILVLRIADWYGKSRLETWAAENNFTLLDCRRGWPWEGPDSWTDGVMFGRQMIYRVTVKDNEDRERLGWVLLGDYWGFNPGKIEWRFDDV